ncbi:MAG: dienelactone hydrolase family protein [Parvularculaceae bacterium]
MKRGLLVSLGVIAALGLAAFMNREALVLTALGLSTEKRSLDEQIALLAPHVEIFAPATGKPPYPAFIQFHGCSGYRPPWSARWAAVANAAGWLAIGVDSNGARGIGREDALKTICAGKKLIGQERAGDISAAIEIARRRSDVDPQRIVLAGWSHGAWSVMDYVALMSAGRAPASLTSAPARAGIAGVALFYPYCGEGSWSRVTRWKEAPPVLAFVAGRDSIVSAEECRAAFAKLKRDGAAVDLADYPDADHAFDDRTNVGGPYEYLYDEAAANDSERRITEFLGRLK